MLFKFSNAVTDFWKLNKRKHCSQNIPVHNNSEFTDPSFQSLLSFWESFIHAVLTQATGNRNYRFTSLWQCSLALLRKYTLHSASHNITSRLYCFYSVFTPQGLRFLSVWAWVTPHFLTISFFTRFSNTVYCTINAVPYRR